MKKSFRKLLSLVLALIITALSVFSSALAVGKETSKSIPTVYVAGQGYHIMSDNTDENSEGIYPYDFELSYVADVIKKLNPVFAKAYITGNYDEYCDVICEAVEPIFCATRLDGNGEPTDGSGAAFIWSHDTLKDEKVDGEYDLFAYNFRYDWRIDPCTTADILSSYINDVLAVTGAEKVNIVSRCLGCNIAAAYIYEYGTANVNKCIFYCGTLEGTAACSKTFSGQIFIDPASVERYAYDLGDDSVKNIIKASVALLNKTNGLNLLSDFVDKIYQQVKANIVPRLLLETYATFPAYWSMIGKDDFETAKKLVFGENNSEYAGLIAKIDHYHYDIQANIRDILMRAKANGMYSALICKYGYQLVPVVPNCKDIADGIVELSLASLGATTSKIDETLSDEYIAAAKQSGTDIYISADKQVDASTCLLPDSTWIIKNIEHKNFPASIDVLITAFLNYDGLMKVNDDERFPQFLVYNGEDGTVSPMTQENAGVTNWRSDSTFALFKMLFKSIFEVIRDYLRSALKLTQIK